MNYYERPTPLQEAAYVEARQHFGEHMKQFKAECESLHNLERNFTVMANDAFKAALQSSGRLVRTDDGTEWQHGVELMKNVSLCHRRATAGLEFAVVESLPLKGKEMKEVLNSGPHVRKVLRTFASDQREVFKLWKDDVTAQVNEYLGKKYPHQDMTIVTESFEIKLARAISERPAQTQNQGRGIRI
jgi:hypothetical protein